MKLIRRMITNHFKAIALIGAIFFTGSAQSHPHYWIDVYADWQFTSKGLVSGVKLRWLFDDYYSVLLAEDTAATGKELQDVLEKILSNIEQHHYFTRIEQQGVQAKLGTPEEARIGAREHRIEIESYLPMTAPLDPKQGDIVYQIAEPTYYFEVLHAEERSAIVLKDAPPSCRYHLEPPKPDAALVAYAAALGVNESGGDSLGI